MPKESIINIIGWPPFTGSYISTWGTKCWGKPHGTVKGIGSTWFTKTDAHMEEGSGKDLGLWELEIVICMEM